MHQCTDKLPESNEPTEKSPYGKKRRVSSDDFSICIISTGSSVNKLTKWQNGGDEDLDALNQSENHRSSEENELKKSSSAYFFSPYRRYKSLQNHLIQEAVDNEEMLDESESDSDAEFAVHPCLSSLIKSRSTYSFSTGKRERTKKFVDSTYQESTESENVVSNDEIDALLTSYEKTLSSSSSDTIQQNLSRCMNIDKFLGKISNDFDQNVYWSAPEDSIANDSLNESDRFSQAKHCWSSPEITCENEYKNTGQSIYKKGRQLANEAFFESSKSLFSDYDEPMRPNCIDLEKMESSESLVPSMLNDKSAECITYILGKKSDSLEMYAMTPSPQWSSSKVDVAFINNNFQYDSVENRKTEMENSSLFEYIDDQSTVVNENEALHSSQYTEDECLENNLIDDNMFKNHFHRKDSDSFSIHLDVDRNSTPIDHIKGIPRHSFSCHENLLGGTKPFLFIDADIQKHYNRCSSPGCRMYAQKQFESNIQRRWSSSDDETHCSQELDIKESVDDIRESMVTERIVESVRYPDERKTINRDGIDGNSSIEIIPSTDSSIGSAYRKREQSFQRIHGLFRTRSVDCFRCGPLHSIRRFSTFTSLQMNDPELISLNYEIPVDTSPSIMARKLDWESKLRENATLLDFFHPEETIRWNYSPIQTKFKKRILPSRPDYLSTNQYASPDRLCRDELCTSKSLFEIISDREYCKYVRSVSEVEKLWTHKAPISMSCDQNMNSVLRIASGDIAEQKEPVGYREESANAYQYDSPATPPINVLPSPIHSNFQSGHRRLPEIPVKSPSAALLSALGPLPMHPSDPRIGCMQTQLNSNEDHRICFGTESVLGRSALLFEGSFYEEDGLNGNHSRKVYSSFAQEDSSGVSSCCTGSDQVTPTHRAHSIFIPRHDDEILLEIGDAIFVERECEDHWCYGTNLRTSKTGIFPSAHICEIDLVEEICMGALPSNANRALENDRDTFYLTMLASIEVAHHKGNDVLIQAMNKVFCLYQNKEEIIVPQTVLMEVTFRGIHIIDKRKKDFFRCPTFDFFYSLQNISFCGAHPKQLRYFGFITKHPLLPRFACHVFLSNESTQPIVEAIGRAFKRSYDEYMAFAHPTEDIYIE